ncbi:MAG: YvcK family protein [Tissierellales bacterium]|nr:YvcK family protein [Tissierellales bacterium]
MDRIIKFTEKRIVAIGGGTGLSVLLRGLKEKTPNITAIVTVADDGGGSGKLREDLGMLPPGDIRSCLVALANTEPSMAKLLQYRFKEGSLKGQSFGNLFIAAMNEIYGSFEKAVEETSNVLKITGKVLPVTIDNVSLIAELEDGTIIRGESKIPSLAKERKSKIKRIRTDPEISYPLKEVIDAIINADIIVLGPGSLYTSIIPNLLVKDIVESIKNSKAKVVYVCNIMTQPGETDNFHIKDHVEAILNHSIDGFLDYCIVNEKQIPTNVLNKYIKDNAKPIYPSESDVMYLNEKGISLISDDFIKIEDNLIRHDTKKLANTIISLI